MKDRRSQELCDEIQRQLGHMLLHICQQGWSLDLNAPGEVGTGWTGRLQPPAGLTPFSPIMAGGSSPEHVVFQLAHLWLEQRLGYR